MKTVMLNMCNTVKLHGICDVASDETLFDNVCYDMTPEQVAMFPDITLSVPNINLVMKASDYILQNCKSTTRKLWWLVEVLVDLMILFQK